MTSAQVIAHWRKGARDALIAAKLLQEHAQYELALFHCHLAIEKALKAAVMEKTGKPHPKVHALLPLASLLKEEWPDDDRELFDTLSDFAVAARYDDPAWAEHYATEDNSRRWIARTDRFLSQLVP